jgi:hypothetical protein
VKQLILASDKEKGSSKGEKALSDCMENGLATFEIKNLIKRRVVNYLVKNYSY